MKPKAWLIFFTGLVMGVSAAALQAFFQVQPPEAYGICLLGHPSTIVKSLLNHITNLHLPLPEIFVAFPSLLVVGIVIGSYLAAYRSKELQWKPGPVQNKYLAFLFGFLVVNFGLLWGACPIRTGLLISYGNIMAVVALFSLAAGVVLACVYVRSKTKRENFRCSR